MDYQKDGVPPARRDPGLREALDQFPGPIAVAHEDISSGLDIGWSCHSTDGETYAVSVTYDAPGQYRLAVKTVRPTSLGKPHTPIENPLIQIVNYLDRADVIAHPDKYRYDPERRTPVEGPGDRFAKSNNLYQPVKNAVVTEVAVPLDGVSLLGRRTDVGGCSVVELGWGEQTVFCVGLPDVIDTVTLRTAMPHDFSSRR